MIGEGYEKKRKEGGGQVTERHKQNTVRYDIPQVHPVMRAKHHEEDMSTETVLLY